MSETHGQTSSEQTLEECKKLLESNRNIILTGAPGTGKTYLAKQIAAKMLGVDYDEALENDPYFKTHVKLVQFHPSYDYTDFVEGLRPVNYEDNSVGFERTDGAFKQFCKTASCITRDLINSYIPNLPFNGHNKSFHITDINEDKNYNYILTVNNSKSRYKLAINVLEEALHSTNTINIDWFSNYLGDKKIKLFDNQTNEISKYYYPIYKQLKKDNDNPFIFIIDEINRGEISKIFGELFFSIDPGYRGIKGRVQTQYQNLVKKGDVFEEGFYVPKNVYIIGTMNDIDRSVESMDFAFRRRFAFVDIKAGKNVDMLGILGEELKEEAKNRMDNLNKEIISEEIGLTEDYQIGASYFLKLKYYEKDKEPFKKLWDHHISGVLKEYLRGDEDAGKKLNKLETAYNNTNPNNNANSDGQHS